MAEPKKFYWIKLQKDFFKQHSIKVIEAMPNGKDYILFYLKLLVESVSHNGNLRFSDTIPYNAEMLAAVTNTNIDVVRSATKVFTELKMMEVMDDQTIYMTELQKMVGCETEWAVKKRMQRQNQALLEDNAETAEGQKGTMSDKSKELRDKSIDNTPIAPNGGDDAPKETKSDERFKAFWKAYPKKVGKGAAEKSFKKYKPDDALLSAMLKAVSTQKSSEQWKKDGGQYIPNPSTWLNQRRWEDESPQSGKDEYLT